MSESTPYYVFFVKEEDTAHHRDGLAEKAHTALLNAGYKLPVLYPEFSGEHWFELRRQWWSDALEQAGITFFESGHLPDKKRHVFRVLPRPTSL